MRPVPFKRIISVSSEDEAFPAKNLLFPATGKKWLCAAYLRTRKAEIEFELCKKARIAELEIGNAGSAFVGIEVGCTDTEGKCTNFVTLLPQSTLMSVPDSRAGKNKSRTARFMNEKLSSVAAFQKWNRVRVVCSQPFNVTEQFGLSQIMVFSQVVKSDESLPPAPDTPSTSSKSLALDSPSSSASTSLAIPSPSTPNQRTSVLSPLNMSAHPLKVLNKSELQDHHPVTPKHRGQASSADTVGSSRRAVREGSPLNEFTGLEAQSSRLYHNAVRESPHNNLEKETNPILLRLMAEREKYRKLPPVPRPKTPERRKLLDYDLPKCTRKTDFILSYLNPSGCAEFSRAMARMAAHENDYEMSKPGRKKKRRNHEPSPGCSEWLTKRKDIVPANTTQPHEEVPIHVQPNAFSRSNEAQLYKDGIPLTQEGYSDGAILNTDGCNKDNGGSCITQLTAESINIYDTEEMIPCPLCGIVLPRSAVIIHAGSCVGTCTSSTMQPQVEVPKHVKLNAFSRSEAQFNKDGIILTQEGCSDVTILNTDGCNEDNGGPCVTQLTAEGIRVHGSEEMISCPLCGIVLPQYTIFIHADSCGEHVMHTD